MLQNAAIVNKRSKHAVNDGSSTSFMLATLFRKYTMLLLLNLDEKAAHMINVHFKFSLTTAPAIDLSILSAIAEAPATSY